MTGPWSHPKNPPSSSTGLVTVWLSCFSVGNDGTLSVVSSIVGWATSCVGVVFVVVGVSIVDFCSSVAGGICGIGVSWVTVWDFGIWNIGVSLVIVGDSDLLSVFTWSLCHVVSFGSISDSVCSFCCCKSLSCLGRAGWPTYITFAHLPNIWKDLEKCSLIFKTPYTRVPVWYLMSPIFCVG